MNATLVKAKAHAIYYGKAAAHTFWQAAVASLIAGFSGGFDLLHIDASTLQRIGTAAALAGVAAVLSYVKQLLVLPKPGSTPALRLPPPVPGLLATDPLTPTK